MAAQNQNAANRRHRVIYGTDTRYDAQLHPNEQLRNVARSVAGMIPKTSIQNIDTNISFESPTLQQAMAVCDTERFAQQKTAAECTGFLVAPDVLVTAGHCVRTQTDCESSAWVFDYVQGNDQIPAINQFGCKEIIAQEVGEKDFAVLRLDRATIDREPLKFRRLGDVQKLEKLAVIGHPSGLPLKIDDDGTLRDQQDEKNFFTAELDTYGGNSGSPVLNLKTLEVEGILVRGERDYIWDAEKLCAVSNVCAAGSCRGEDVQKITKVRGLPFL